MTWRWSRAGLRQVGLQLHHEISHPARGFLIAGHEQFDPVGSRRGHFDDNALSGRIEAVLNQAEQLLGVYGFGDVVIRLFADGFEQGIWRVVRGHNNDRRRRGQGPLFFQGVPNH